MDSKEHPIFSNYSIMSNLKQFFSKVDWEKAICALRNPLDEEFDLCNYCPVTNIVTIGGHYNDDDD